jgi:Fe-S-cluster containining protein
MASGDDESQKPRVRLPMVPEDVESGLRFNHIVAHQTRVKLAELSASYYALIETLVARGIVPIDDYERRRQQTMERENDKAKESLAPHVSQYPDKYKLEQLPQIDCEARLHLCKAKCCTLTFPLSVQDLDERVVRWDYAKPYQIGRRPDGYCVHNKAGTCLCEVYEHRPGVCRTYDCRQDKRIWADFEARIPAPPPEPAKT